MEETIELTVKVRINYPDKSRRNEAIKGAKECALSSSVLGWVGCKAKSAKLVVPNKTISDKKDWNNTMKAWKPLFKKLLSIQSKLKKSRGNVVTKNIDGRNDKYAVIKHIDDCIAMITWEIRRCDIDGANKGILETTKLIEKGSFIYFS